MTFKERRRIAIAILRGKPPRWPTWSHGRMVSLGFHWVVHPDLMGGHWEPNP